ncbi:MAG TPA: SDR family oxidoreductase [Chloroflexia bacterium]|nr:SDR family oxidoreductase [Chloroflexia bacterium]
MELEGKVALVTGGGRGLGRATALALAEQGARVATLARSLPEVEETARLIRQYYGVGRSMALRADVTNEHEVVQAFDTIRSRWGGVDILINNAGDWGATKPISSLTLDEWQQALDVNLTGVFLCSREAFRDMSRRRWGRIINVSSGSATVAVPSMGPYSIAKAAVEHLTRLLAAEGALIGITAVALRPGVVDTRMQEDLRNRTPDSMPPELRAIFAAYKQKGHLVAPERPAQMIAYLCTDRGRDANGRILDADEMEALLVR